MRVLKHKLTTIIIFCFFMYKHSQSLNCVCLLFVRQTQLRCRRSRVFLPLFRGVGDVLGIDESTPWWDSLCTNVIPKCCYEKHATKCKRDYCDISVPLVQHTCSTGSAISFRQNTECRRGHFGSILRPKDCIVTF